MVIKMNKKFSRSLGLILIFAMCLSFLASCGTVVVKPVRSYTYNIATSELSKNWNPHTNVVGEENSVLEYITSPFCAIVVKDTKTGEYQWAYDMATEITDVTGYYTDVLAQYPVNLPEGKIYDTVDFGYIFEIKLNPAAKWQNGDIINADSYIYSMKALLDTQMRNQSAEFYINGKAAIAGAYEFCNSEKNIYMSVVTVDEESGVADYSFELGSVPTYISLTENSKFGYSLAWFVQNMRQDISDSTYDAVMALTANEDGYIQYNDETKATIEALLEEICIINQTSIYNVDGTLNDTIKDFLYYINGKTEKLKFEKTVGLYKVDDYTLHYITKEQHTLEDFLMLCSSTWLVHEGLYESGKTTQNGVVTTNYGTSMETTMSYGPYRFEWIRTDDKPQMVLVQNENWLGYTKQTNGSLASYTEFAVDGEKRQQYMTTRIVIEVMSEEDAKQAFFKGQISRYIPAHSEMTKYSGNEKVYSVDGALTSALFINSNEDILKSLDESTENINSVVLSNADFRRALSLAIDRAQWALSTPAYKPALSMISPAYYYDLDGNPVMYYRTSDDAKQTICALYGVEYGKGKEFTNLKAAYESVKGYDIEKANELMKQACEQLVADGEYVKGEDIVIRVAWSKTALTENDKKQVSLLQKYINSACEESGFGIVTLLPVGNVQNVVADEEGAQPEMFAISFEQIGDDTLQLYDIFATIDETGYAAAMEWTLEVNGKDVTMTCGDWVGCMTEGAIYSKADAATKLSITAQLEEKFLGTFCIIPLVSHTTGEMLSYKISYCADMYDVKYGFGGFRLLNYNYNDEAWLHYVAAFNGTLPY